MSARWLAFVIWAAVAASAVFWLLRLTAGSPSAPAHTVAVGSAALPRGDLARVLGVAPKPAEAGPAAVPAMASRFKLLGVASPRQGSDRTGLALIAVDGKPARSFKVGAPIDGDLVLQSVHPRGAALGVPGSVANLNLELPALPPAATGTRPPSGGGVPGFVPPPPGLPGLGVPGSGPIATLPSQAPGADSQEPVPVPPPPPQPGNPNTR